MNTSSYLPTPINNLSYHNKQVKPQINRQPPCSAIVQSSNPRHTRLNSEDVISSNPSFLDVSDPSVGQQQSRDPLGWNPLLDDLHSQGFESSVPWVYLQLMWFYWTS
ncbi:hypothetical protein BY996DRAFT_6530012 [Phakopsora pachyrhizi]|nr:hypothetical protein BY996DRAFT_6530012 [Phakopsora pachyrhizi]